MWSLLPQLYGLHYLVFATMNHIISPRLIIVTAFQLLWGIRLTFNYWRKGGYERQDPIILKIMSRGSEDYRWIFVRKLVRRYVPVALESVALTNFNLIFVSFIQNTLLFFLTAPYVPPDAVFDRL
jgi:steroid 5-alpha reductase family enzyme